MRLLALIFCLLISGNVFSQKKKQPTKKDTVSLAVFLKKISKEPTTDKLIKSNSANELKTLTLYYDPKTNVSIVRSDLSKRNR